MHVLFACLIRIYTAKSTTVSNILLSNLMKLINLANPVKISCLEKSTVAIILSRNLLFISVCPSTYIEAGYISTFQRPDNFK